MKKNEFELLEQMILSDKGFAKKLADNPEQTLSREGIRLTTEVLEVIKGIDGSAFEKLVAALQPADNRK